MNPSVASFYSFYSFYSFFLLLFLSGVFLVFDFSYVDVLLLKSSPALGNEQHNVIPGPYPWKNKLMPQPLPLGTTNSC